MANDDLVDVEISAALVRDSNAGFVVERARISSIRPDELLVRVIATGLCHTDISVMQGLLPTPMPIVLGHEGAGIVEKIGSAVRGIAPGDHIVMTYLSCGQCRECLGDTPARCAHLYPLCFGGCRPDGSHALQAPAGELVHDRFFGQSSFATYAIAHQNNVIKVDKDLPIATLGPLGCGIQTGAGAVWNDLKVWPGASIAIYGTGAVGLSAVMAAAASGASTIVAIDRVQLKLALARELGATHTILAGDEPVGDALRSILPLGPDLALDTTGGAQVIVDAARSLRHAGTIGLVAPTRDGQLSLDVIGLIAGCKTIRGIIEGGGSAKQLIPRIIDLHRQGRFPFGRLLTFYPFNDIAEAVRDSLAGDVIKPVLLMNAAT
jgi:aryl-alcohol dehydrogenase